MSEEIKSGKHPQQSATVPLPRMKRGIRFFFTEVWRELKRVNWPSVPETNRLTGVVIAVCFLIALVLTVLHLGVQTILSILNPPK